MVASGEWAEASETDSSSGLVVEEDDDLACLDGFEPPANFLQDTIMDWTDGVVGELASGRCD
jgi:hypothetical protein